MENETIGAMPESVAKKDSKNKKKIILCSVLSVLAVGLIIGAFFVGKNCDKGSDDDRDIDAISAELEFAQADLESSQARISQLEADLAEATGQEVVEKSLQEQLREAFEEFGSGGTVFGVQDIENSPIAPFQTVEAHISVADNVGGYTGLFWRNGTSGEWRFFMGAQTNLLCNDFFHVRRAFAGYPCVDHDGDLVVIGEYFNLF